MKTKKIKQSKRQLKIVEHGVWPGWGDGLTCTFEFNRRNSKENDWMLELYCRRDVIYGTDTVKTTKMRKCSLGEIHYEEREVKKITQPDVHERMMLGLEEALLLRDRLNEWFSEYKRLSKIEEPVKLSKHDLRRSDFDVDDETLERIEHAR